VQFRLPRQATLAFLAFTALACDRHTVPTRNAERPPARYLFAWTGDEDRAHEDFLAVVDLARDGDRYGTIVATTPVGEKGLWPHHTEHELDTSRMLFANGYSANRTLLFDLHDALHPKKVERFNGFADSTFLHSLTRLPNGHSIATFQAHGENNIAPGHEHNGNQVQVFRLSDLSLIKTIKLPANDGPNEPRLFPDGRTVLVNTVECRPYQVTDLAGTNPQLDLVHQESPRGCAMPLVMGKYWVQANAADHSVFSLDISDLKNVRRVSSVSSDEKQRPYWLATDGTRIVVVNEPSPTAERRMWMLQVSQTTGRITLDSAFRDAGSRRPGLAFDRPNRPHGATGNAVPHGPVFGW